MLLVAHFWGVYWVIAVPLVILVFVVTHVLSSKLALVNSLLSKKIRIKTADKMM
jgi:hypothetical protein